tara:strand:+ start:619 stop:1209 length:591 start_codon:yes stop_codon:yes gene_type:complete
MRIVLQPVVNHQNEGLLSDARDLLSQQVWCWGRDICRKEGNWLLEYGFKRTKPPKDSGIIFSAYSLELPNNRCIILRGSGVFYGDLRYGGVFISRHDFTPRYTKNSTLENPFWSISEMDEFRLPNQEEKVDYNALITGLISWITTYEENIIDCLGMGYRRASLIKWDNGERVVIASEEIINEWENLSRTILNENPF